MANCKKDETALKAQISRILITRHTVQDKFTSTVRSQNNPKAWQIVRKMKPL